MIAMVYSALGDKEQVYTWLERAVEERSANVSTMRSYSEFETLQGEQRFNEILKRVGLK